MGGCESLHSVRCPGNNTLPTLVAGSCKEGVQSCSIPSTVGMEVWEHPASQRVQQHAVHRNSSLAELGKRVHCGEEGGTSRSL